MASSILKRAASNQDDYAPGFELQSSCSPGTTPGNDMSSQELQTKDLPTCCREEMNDGIEKPAVKLDKPRAEGRSLKEEFEAGVQFGKSALLRFKTPKIDDPGLPIADSLVSVSGTVLLTAVILLLGAPRPSWLVPSPWVPQWRSLPFVVPAITHGSSLASCWVLGALSARAFEKEAFADTRREAWIRSWKAGAFATGLLIIGTQVSTTVSFAGQGLVPVLGESYEGDLQLVRTLGELILDIVVQATVLTAWRQLRYGEEVP
ncbi:hypothetical protein CYMTET_6492 [Cymbomonas tetramitiformis]|uniref:Uncharacterized protein n=1 Tax=Cymbomonas tetramitiformis TaxID=36881 RepID=A0AAE0GXG0_9CHLO|nr:hypothetical protein CYMTET_6492 [Cymbomonas tetramitiformis]